MPPRPTLTAPGRSHHEDRAPLAATASTPSPTPVPAAEAEAERRDLVMRIRERLSTDRVRIVEDHAWIVLALRAMRPRTIDVHAIYKVLVDQGHDISMSKLYRSLKMLEAAGMIRRHWEPNHGRPRSVYGAVEDGSEDGAGAASVCAHCGAPVVHRPDS